MRGSEATDFFFNFLALLPFVMVIYYALSSPWWRRSLLLLTGFILIYGVAPRLCLLYAFFSLASFGLQRMILSLEGRERVQLLGLWVAILLLLAPLLLWKVYPEPAVTHFNLWSHHLLTWLSSHLGEVDASCQIIFPIGISFVTFRVLDLMVRSYLGLTSRLSLQELSFYVFFPPILIMGPVSEYGELEAVSKGAPKFKFEDLSQGLQRLVRGLIKVFVLAAFLKPSQGLFQGFEQVSVSKCWWSLFVFMWYFFFNFSGYSDLAIGSARLLGFRLKENFNHPYFKTNIRDFWNSWHMSLTRFANRNVFMPLGGFRPQRQVWALSLTMMTIALWHGLTWPFVLFGTYHAVGLNVHRWAEPRLKKRHWGVWGTYIFATITFVFVSLSFPLVVLKEGEVLPFYLKLMGMAF